MPTAFVSGFRKLAHELGAIPGEFGVHPYTVSFVTKGWSGSTTGKGTATETVVPITRANGQPPKVEPVSEHRAALGIGFEIGDLTIGPITPVEGASWATLLQTSVTDDNELLVRVTHTESGLAADYRITHVDKSKALGVKLTVKPVTG